MTTPLKYLSKYKINTTRLPNHDYSVGTYFITICTKNREHFFGKIIDNEMQLSEIGHIVKNEWVKTPQIRPDMGINLGAYIIMPNHFHCIIDIVNGFHHCCYRRDAMHCVSTIMEHPKCVSTMDTIKSNKFGPQSKNLASIIRGFKIGVTKNARIINPEFSWQPRYYEHCIRTNKELEKITAYIVNNPINWENDDNYA